MKKRILASALALVLTMSMAACGAGQPTGTDAPATGETAAQTQGYEVDTLKLAGGSDWGVPSPYLNVSRGPGQSKMRLVFASLLEKDETGDVAWLAESWKVEGNNYTFTLFPDTKFHDGTPLTTEDIAFTLDYFRQYPPVTNWITSASIPL